MDDSKVRAWWFHRQGLDGELAGKPPAKILERAGWARSVGGVGPYLTLFARGGIARQAADDAAARLEIQELPGPRGCTYVVPASDFALALRVGQGLGDEGRTAGKLGVPAKEIDKLCSAVVKALNKGPLDPEELRKAAAGAIRSLGIEGKKIGLTNTLPVALERLQSEGEIRRVPVHGRLDQQRYRYALWRPNPLAGFKLSTEEAYAQLAQRFFSWIGPATQAEFQWFSGLGVKAAKTAMEPLALEPLEPGGELKVLPGDRDRFAAFHPPRKPQFVLVSSLDGISHLRRDVKGMLAPEDMRWSILCEKGPMGLSSHAILDRGRLVGLWEFDVDSQSIAWMSFIPRNKELADAVARTEQYVCSELGDARSFSLDSPKSRAPRIAALRKAAR